MSFFFSRSPARYAFFCCVPYFFGIAITTPFESAVFCPPFFFPGGCVCWAVFFSLFLSYTCSLLLPPTDFLCRPGWSRHAHGELGTRRALNPCRVFFFFFGPH